ncbi:MAG TPA: hypothetical protein ENJ45_02495, partial [Phaeodactylibacter sp.]|nr:hypothetical protein [Phaeodactylibacter sp.]
MLSSFLEGIFAYTQAARYLTKKGLWGYAVLPGIISLLLGASIGYAAWSGADNIGTWLIAWYPLEWGAAALAKISVWLGGAVLFLVGLMLYKHLVMIIVSPLMTPLSQKIEQQLLGQIET